LKAAVAILDLKKGLFAQTPGWPKCVNLV